MSDKKFIIEWSTVTFCSASIITNIYREGGGGLFCQNALHFTPVVCLYTHKFGFWDSIWSEYKKKMVPKKQKNPPCVEDWYGCLSKIPGTVCLRASALCAVLALAI